MTRGLATAGLVAFAGVAILVGSPWDPAGFLRTAFSGLQAAPAPLFFGVMAIACLFPVPVSPFYLTAGSLYGSETALAGSAVALAASMALSHVAAGSLLRPRLVDWLARRDHAAPRLRDTSDELLVILLVRITPGLPLFAQNVALGAAGVGLGRLLLLSVPIQMVFATGFVLLGRSAFEGRSGLALLGVGLIGGAAIVARLVHRRLRPDPST